MLSYANMYYVSGMLQRYVTHCFMYCYCKLNKSAK